MARFYEFDTDHSGCLSRHELAALCQSLGASLTKHELEVALFVLDDDGDGSIKAIEFLRWWKSSQFNIVDVYM
jgi:Ca2+-binding EF-hand superfamily protein